MNTVRYTPKEINDAIARRESSAQDFLYEYAETIREALSAHDTAECREAQKALAKLHTKPLSLAK
jgi:hypothetical protein